VTVDGPYRVVREESVKYPPFLAARMGNMATCACGWTIISPIGAEDVQKHLLIHLHDTHPGTKVSDGELRTMIKAV